MRTIKLALLIVLSVNHVIVWGQAKLVEKVVKSDKELVIPYEKYVLPNGLTLIVHEDHSDPIVHVDVTYHVGSAREELGKSGFAHFFEHMLFQGSDHVGDEQHFKIVTAGGGTLNGSTNRDRTNYYETLPGNQLEKVLWLEADRMGFFLDAVTQKKFEIQRSTVKNEKGQRYDNVPYGKSYELYSRMLYPYGHPYSWLTIGYVEDLNRVDVNDLKNFFLRWYGPNNAVLTIGGDVKTAEVVKMVEKYFGSILRGPSVDPVKVPLVSLSKDRNISYVDNYAKLPMLQITYPTVPDYHQDKAALLCLAQVLGQGRNSILYQQMVKTQTALQANAGNYFTELAGEFSMQITPTAGKSLADMERAYRSSLDSFESRGVINEDVVKFKAAMEAQALYGLQSVSGKVSQLAAFQTYTGNPNQISKVLSSYASLTKEDIMGVYRKYIKGKGAVVLSILPTGKEQLVAAPDNFKTDSSTYEKPNYGYEGLRYVKGKDRFDRNKMPGNGPNPVVKVPKFWRKDLSNGARVIGTHNEEVPIVTMTVSMPGGHLAVANDLSKAGLADLFTDMMMEDTKRHSAEYLSDELQKLGSAVSIYFTTDRVVFSVSAIKKNLDAVLKILEERMMEPAFTEASFTRVKKQAIESARAQKGSSSTVASQVFAKLNYGPNHILGVPESGTEQTLQSISLQDIKNYYQHYISSMDAKVVVVGDVTEGEVMPRLSFLNRLPRKKISLAAIPPAAPVAKTKIYLVDMPKGAQTDFRIGYATGLTYDPLGNSYKATLSNFPLGGGFNSRLNLNLREDKGWTYGAGSAFESNPWGGHYLFGSSIKGDATDSALVEIMKEMNSYVQNGVTDKELEFMKTAIAQGEARSYETGMQKAQFIGRILDYNLPANYMEQQKKLLQNMTASQLNQITRTYIRPDQINIILAGDKTKILDKVKKLGYEVVEVDTNGDQVEQKRAF